MLSILLPDTVSSSMHCRNNNDDHNTNDCEKRSDIIWPVL